MGWVSGLFNDALNPEGHFGVRLIRVVKLWYYICFDVDVTYSLMLMLHTNALARRFQKRLFKKKEKKKLKYILTTYHHTHSTFIKTIFQHSIVIYAKTIHCTAKSLPTRNRRKRSIREIACYASGSGQGWTPRYSK